MEIVDHGFFRVTRDADFDISDEADDLLRAVEAELRRRRFGEVVRLEVDSKMSADLRGELTEALEVEERQVYVIDGLLDLTDLWQIVKLPGFSDLRDAPWTPVTQPRLQGEDDGHVDIFSVIRAGDVLVHHPYDSFATSVERFVEQAANDPDVLAIKMTVYRTSDDTPLVPALIRATERGKQAVCLVEVKARGDERANIQWARAMEEAGVHVVYGHPALKTHAKCLLVVRREGDGVRHYVHIGTGNYHPQTARLYTDFGLFTCDEQIGADVADMFNFLTGYARPRRYRKVLVAPNFLRDAMIAEIERTVAAHEEGQPARIAMKMNSLVDRRCIRALYRASQAGVPVDLNIRGICCLVPGVPGVSENIRVNSVVGRFLEHSRIFAFERNGETKVYIGSADLMPRNLDTRVELVTPVEDPSLRDDLLDTLERSLADDTNSWDLGPDNVWRRRTPGGPRAALGPARAHARPPGRARPRAPRPPRHGRSLSASSPPRLRCSRHVRSLGLRSRRRPRGAGRGRGLRRRRANVAWKGAAALRPGRGRPDALRHAREPLGPPAAAARRRRARARSQRPRAVGRGRVLRRLQRRHRRCAASARRCSPPRRPARATARRSPWPPARRSR